MADGSAKEPRGRLAGDPIVQTGVGGAPRVCHNRRKGNHRNSRCLKSVNAGPERGGLGRHQDDPVAAAPDGSRQQLLHHRNWKVVSQCLAHPKCRRSHHRQFRRERRLKRVEKCLRRLDNNVGHHPSPGERKLLALLLKLDNRPMHAVDGLLPHGPAPVQYPVHCGRADTGLKGDVLDEKTVWHLF